MMSDSLKKKLVVIAGPTATGKSDAAVKLSEIIGGEVISADSIQVYRGMDIGSAKISVAEMKGIPHHLIDVMDPSEDYNVVRFKSMAEKAMEGIYQRGHIPVVCGGTGFYIQALIYGIDFKDEPDEDGSDSCRKYFEEIYVRQGPEKLISMLAKEDPASYDVIDHHNIKRVIRALTYMRVHGESIQEHNKREALKRLDPPYDLRFFVLYGERSGMYERINKRVDLMMASGLCDEVRSLLDSGLRENSTAAQGIGYKEIIEALKNNSDLNEAAEKIKLNTRRFAKRQLTWFKREKAAIWINIDKGDPVNEIRKYLW